MILYLLKSSFYPCQISKIFLCSNTSCEQLVVTLTTWEKAKYWTNQSVLIFLIYLPQSSSLSTTSLTPFNSYFLLHVVLMHLCWYNCNDDVDFFLFDTKCGPYDSLVLRWPTQPHIIFPLGGSHCDFLCLLWQCPNKYSTQIFNHNFEPFLAIKKHFWPPKGVQIHGILAPWFWTLLTIIMFYLEQIDEKKLSCHSIPTSLLLLFMIYIDDLSIFFPLRYFNPKNLMPKRSQINVDVVACDPSPPSLSHVLFFHPKDEFLGFYRPFLTTRICFVA